MAQHRGDDDACHHVGERPKLEERERWVLPKYRNHGRGDDDDVEGEGWVDKRGDDEWFLRETFRDHW